MLPLAAAQRAGRGIRATWAVVAVELCVLAALPHPRFASVWELGIGSLLLAPTVLLAGALLGLLGEGITALLEAGERPRARATLTVLSLASGVAVAWAVGGGRLLAAPGVRGGFAAGVGALGAALAMGLAPSFARWLRARPGQVLTATVVGILMASLLNRFVLVRLYPAFHLALALLALLSAPTAAAALGALRGRPERGAETASGLASRRRRAVSTWVTLGAVLVGAVSARPAARWLAQFDNYRMVMLEEGPLLGQAVRLAGTLAPPDAPAATACADDGACAPSAESAASGHPLDLRGRDLLLVTIDALRADHVGAYGYPRRTTPQLDALAAQGVLFEHAYCPTPHTSYSVTSLMTGKYLRPLLLQGAGEDSDTWAGLLRGYGYRTAGFYPPALFYIDAQRFQGFRERRLDFEYTKVEFAEGPDRIRQVRDFLDQAPSERRLFVWVHLFAPHEPYEAHPEHPFGDRDVDRYDSEIAFADATMGAVVELFRQRRPSGAVIVSADHGEEFGDHGGHYHGTTVYEEQVRVPLVVSAPGLLAPRRISEVVQTIDLLPTVLATLEIPRPPRLRGRDLGMVMAGARPEEPGLALAETDEQALLAEGEWRLLCARQVGACRLFDLTTDPRQLQDVGPAHAERYRTMRERLRALGASHGTYEVTGLRAEGRGWPGAILRGIAGDGDAAEEIAALLEDADREIRRQAAEILFTLRRPETAPALRLALGRDEDVAVRRWCALALTRLGQGAPLVSELLTDPDLRWRRLAALALAESGDRRGEGLLVAWWRDEPARDHQRSRELLRAFATLRSEDAVWPLCLSLGDVRLRPFIAETLAAIGHEAARIPLARALAEERYQSARVALTSALVRLGAEGELAAPLVRFLGVPDPLPGGVEAARTSGILAMVGGPDEKGLAQLQRDAGVGVVLNVFVPKGGNGRGVRVLVRAHNHGTASASVHLGARADRPVLDAEGKPKRGRRLPVLDGERSLSLPVPPGAEPIEVHAILPETLRAEPGRALTLVLYAERDVTVSALAAVPLSDELPPPAPQPWAPGAPPD